VIGLRIEPPVVADDVSRVVTVQMTNGYAAPLTNVVVGLHVPPELGLEQGRTTFELAVLAPGVVHEHALQIRPSPPGRHAITVRNLSCRNGAGRTHRERNRTMEIDVEERDDRGSGHAETPVPTPPGRVHPLRRTRRSVFVSYRRHDTKLMVPGLVRDLGKRKSLRHVDLFLDLTDIPAGSRWASVLDAELQSCDVLVAVIGPNWMTPLLRDPDDVVRREITTVLGRGVPVVPLLVDTQPPDVDALGPELGGLADWQALIFDIAAYGSSVTRLATALTDLLSSSAGTREPF
jgi:TIR domain-containing protein